MSLTTEQIEGLNIILDMFNEKYPPKYFKGAKEYNTNISDMSELDLAYNLLEEGMDTVAYAAILINKLESKQP